MIDVVALIRQIAPQAILADDPTNRLRDGLDHSGYGISGAVGHCRPNPFSGMNEKEKQHSRQRDDEGRGNDGRSASVDGICEGFFKDVEPPQSNVTTTNPASPPKVRTGCREERVTWKVAHSECAGWTLRACVSPSKNPDEPVQAQGISKNQGSGTRAGNNPSS